MIDTAAAHPIYSGPNSPFTFIAANISLAIDANYWWNAPYRCFGRSGVRMLLCAPVIGHPLWLDTGGDREMAYPFSGSALGCLRSWVDG
jgi:hypothetical protein